MPAEFFLRKCPPSSLPRPIPALSRANTVNLLISHPIIAGRLAKQVNVLPVIRWNATCSIQLANSFPEIETLTCQCMQADYHVRLSIVSIWLLNWKCPWVWICSGTYPYASTNLHVHSSEENIIINLGIDSTVLLLNTLKCYSQSRPIFRLVLYTEDEISAGSEKGLILQRI